MTEELEFRKILEDSGMNQKEFAEKVGLSHSGVRNGLARGTKKGVSVWLKAFLLGWNLSEKKSNAHALSCGNCVSALGCASQGADSDET